MTPAAPADLKRRVLAAAAEEPSLTRPEARYRAVVASLLASIPMAAALLIAGGPGHAEGRPLTVTILQSIGCAALAAFVTWAAGSRAHGIARPRSRRVELWLLAIGAPLLLAVWICAFHSAYQAPFERLGVRCFALALVTAPWPFAAMVMWRKVIEPHRPALLGAALGAASGLWSGLMVILWCPLSDPGHVARGHLSPFILFVGLGAILGARLFRVKSQPSSSTRS